MTVQQPTANLMSSYKMAVVNDRPVSIEMTYGLHVRPQDVADFLIIEGNSLKTLKKQVIAITLPVVLYGCEAWSLTLREKCRLRVF